VYSINPTFLSIWLSLWSWSTSRGVSAYWTSPNGLNSNYYGGTIVFKCNRLNRKRSCL